MDKLNIILAAVKKYQFWVLCGVTLLTTLVCWWLATSGLAEQFKSRKSQIEGDISGTSIKPNHPNQGVIAKINEQHALLKKGVFEAWKTLYSEQKKNNPFPTKVLGEDFQKQFESLPPPPQPLGRLDNIFLERYQRFLIEKYLPGLSKMIEMRRPVETETDANRPAGNNPRPRAWPGVGGTMSRSLTGGNEEEMTGIVDWNATDYDRLLGRFTWTEVPSTLEVVLAQEDLWVYEALLRVIQSANKGATTQSNAAVKKIEALEIGKDAQAAWSAKRSFGGMPSTMATGTATSTSGSDDQWLFDARYVDEMGQPVPVEAQYPYAKHPYAEFKMMPIHMTLLMDQRRLPKFLVDCANSNMPIEVRRVRILKNPTLTLDISGQATKAGTSKPGSGPMPGAGPMMPPGAMRRGPTTSQGMPGANMASVDDVSGDLDVPVEIFAIIYIYNPPDRQKLGTGTAAGNNPADATGGPAPASSEQAAPPAPPANPGK